MEKDLSTEEWKQQKKEQRAIFTARQRLPYELKLKRQARRAWQFYEELLSRDMNCHVSVGGLDSITLYIWLLSIGIEVPAISVTHVEDVSIQRVHKALGIEIVRSYKSKVQVLNEMGCEMCGFGIHLEQRPHRFDRLRERNPKAWEFWMYRCCTDPETGEKYGWGRVLDYIGVEWEDIPPVQMTIFDYPEVLP